MGGADGDAVELGCHVARTGADEETVEEKRVSGTFVCFKRFKARALARPDVKKAYDDLAEEFAFLDEVLKARLGSGLTQAEVAARIGTTQSAIARLESAEPKHSPSIATLQKYAKALGYKVEVRLVKNARRRTTVSTAHTAKATVRRSA